MASGTMERDTDGFAEMETKEKIHEDLVPVPSVYVVILAIPINIMR